MKDYKSYLKLLGMVALFFSLTLFQNCAEPIQSEDQSSTLGGPDTTRELMTIAPGGGRNTGVPGTISLTEDGTIISPGSLAGIGGASTISPPPQCISNCVEHYQCNTRTNTTERNECNNYCSTDGGACSSLSIPRDTNTLTEFQIPPGYKKAEVTVEHCGSLSETLIVEGPALSFNSDHNAIAATKVKEYQRASLTLFGLEGVQEHIDLLQTVVGLGEHCRQPSVSEFFNVAHVKIRLMDDNGNLENERLYKWKVPSALSFDFNMISDLTWDAPVFINLKSVKVSNNTRNLLDKDKGALILHRIYDNYKRNKQLSFLVGYYNGWSMYSPRTLVTKFDLWYKKGNNENFSLPEVDTTGNGN